MRHPRIPIALVALCGSLVAAAGAWAEDASPPRPTGIQATAAPANPPSDLPDIGSLTAESDFSLFMAQGVPAELRRRALRKLWSLDPQFLAADGLGDYVEDYTTIESRVFAQARRLIPPEYTPNGPGMQATAEPVSQPPGLSKIESLTADSDFTVFMTDSVPAQLRYQALRKLWSVDPQLAFIDGLGDYAADYTGTGAAYVAGKPVRVAVQLGTDRDEFIITPAQLRFEANRRYELVVTNPSDTAHHLSAPQFGANVITHKAVVYDDDRQFVRIWLDGERASAAASFAAQLTRGVEIRPGGEARWIFIPTRAGQFDFGCAIAGHRKEGMVGSITVGL